MKRNSRLTVVIATVSGIVTLLSSCSGSKPDMVKSQPGTVSLVGAGSSFDAVLFNRWLTVYHANNPGVLIDYASVGSGEGIRRFIGKNLPENERIDFGASDSAMSDAEIAQANDDTLMLPVTSACLVLSYNLPDFHGELKLSRKAYSGIFLGDIKKWNDPVIAQANPGMQLPDLDIVLAVRQDVSGTTFAFTNNLSSISERWHSLFGPATFVHWRGNVLPAKGNEGVSALIERSAGSIGYIGYEFGNRLGLDMAAIENKEGKYIQPSEQSCIAGLASADLPGNLRVFVPDPSGADSYPIVTYSWVLLRKHYKDHQTSMALEKLFSWCLQDGQRYSSQIGYVPLPSSVAQKSLGALTAFYRGG